MREISIRNTLTVLNDSMPKVQRVAIADQNIARLHQALKERVNSPDVRSLLEKEAITIARIDFTVRYKSQPRDVDQPLRTSLSFVEEESQSELPGISGIEFPLPE